MARRAVLLLLLAACAHRPDCAAYRCAADIPANVRDEPKALHDLILDARTRHFPDACFSCEAGTPCATCEQLVTSAIHRLAEIPTDDAAKEAAAIVVDARLQWDGGPALIVSHAVAGMGQRVVPYLQPHGATSALAAEILNCIERKQPCI